MATKPKTRVSPYDQVLTSTTPDTLIAGVDEVGRGALFGPVVAAAVVFPVKFLANLDHIVVKDSKALTPKQRRHLAEKIQQIAHTQAVGLATAAEIDQINILQASLLAMNRAIINLSVQPEICLVDGQFRLPNLPLKQINLIKGDERFSLIAAASIVAKVWRDELILKLSSEYPNYELARNKGYGTLKHRLAICEYGTSPEHRLSFRPCQASPKTAEF